MRRGRILGVVAAVGALAGCGESGGEVPAACEEGPDAVRAALRAAPGEVRLDGTPLSDCLDEDSDPAELQNVGSAYIETAAALAPQARRRPEGRAALELGYLVGAARSGGSDTQGVHTELLRRLEQELSSVDTRAAAFRRGQRAAGR